MAQFPLSYSDITAQRARQRKPILVLVVVASLALAGWGGYFLLTRNSQPHLSVSKVDNLNDLDKLSNDVTKINDSLKKINLRK